MRIVNPLYDQAFKYMMDNEAIAKKILSLDIDLLTALAYEEDYEESVKNLEDELTEERRQKEEAQKQKEVAQQKIMDLAKLLKSMNIPIEEIATKTGLSTSEIESL